MRKLLMIGAAVAALSFATPAAAEQSQAGYAVGGAITGGTIGFIIGGPIGAIIGGWTGAALGATVLSHEVAFAPGDSVRYDGDLSVGAVVDDSVRLRGIEGEDRYGYFRSGGNIYIVDRNTREIVEIRRG